MARERLDFDIFAHDRNAKRTFDGVADGADGAAESFDGLGKQSKHLDAEILRLERSTKELVATFRSTDDVELFRQFGKDQRQLNLLRRMRKELVGLAGDAAKFSLSGLTGAIEALPQQVKGAAIVAAAGAAVVIGPAIGAAITGAIVGAVGSGAIAAGIASAARSPRVKAAWAEFGDEAESVFADFGMPFIQPTVAAIGILRGSLAEIGDDLEGIAGDAARFVEPLARGVGGFVEEMMPGLRALVREAQPVFDMLEDELPRVGRAVGEFFDDLGDGAEGGAESLQAFLRVVEFTLGGIGEQLKIFANAIEGASILNDRFGGTLDFLFGDDKKAKARDFADTGGDALKEVGDAAAEAGEEAEKAARHFEDLFSQWMGVDESAIAVEGAIDDVTESLRENGTSLDINTEKGRENAKSFLDGAAAAERHRQKMIESGQSIPYANKVFQETVDKLYAQAAAAGVDMGALDGLLGKYRDLANVPNITKTITYKQVFTSSGQAYAPVGGGHTFNAEGGLITGPGTGTSDDIVTRVSNGEYVLRAAAVRALGVDTLNALNQADRSPARRSPARPGAAAKASGWGGITVEHLEIKSYGDRFSTGQVMQDLAMHGVH